MDAPRDSGFHWNILDYSLNNLKNKSIKNIDPNATELITESIAQMGVLVLRLAGEHSHNKQKSHLDISDVFQGFLTVQKAIDTYDFTKTEKTPIKIQSSKSERNEASIFKIISKKAKVNFTHKSADWLSRHIRSYTVSNSENIIKLAIPPAFGGSGVAYEDINNDGLIDMLLLGGYGNKLFLNTKSGQFKDITKASAINHWNQKVKLFRRAKTAYYCRF